MCRLAFRDIACAEVSDLEATIRGSGYTLELLEALRAREPGVALRLILGSDLLGEIDRWHRWDRIAEIAPPIIVGRQGSPHQVAGPLMPDISSTLIRERLAANGSVDGLLPAEVIRYVREHGLYGSSR
jgi:nicotinate-nucleotide adenylyltransferase